MEVVRDNGEVLGTVWETSFHNEDGNIRALIVVKTLFIIQIGISSLADACYLWNGIIYQT